MSAHESPRLGRIALFAGVGEEALAGLEQQVHETTFPPAAQVVSADQPGEAVYFVLAGKVRVYLEQPDGSSVTFAFLGPGDLFGEMSVVDDTLRSASAVTMEKSTLLWLDRATFQRCLRELPAVALNLVRELSARLRKANEQIRALATLDVAGRVVRQLLALADQYGETDEAGRRHLPLPLTQSDIADMVAATRERVNRVMVALGQEGALRVEPDHHITLLDEALLARHLS
jgi:CRP-like cAMP-binding protein